MTLKFQVGQPCCVPRPAGWTRHDLCSDECMEYHAGGNGAVEKGMERESIEVFAVCGAEAIAPGHARPFSLSQIAGSGEARPYSIFVVRGGKDSYFGYVNICPHEKTWLNIRDGGFLNPDGTFLRCSRHGALFEIGTGRCVAGPCEGANLEPVALAVIDGDVCVCGVPLIEEDGIDAPTDDFEDMMEIMIHPG